MCHTATVSLKKEKREEPAQHYQQEDTTQWILLSNLRLFIQAFWCYHRQFPNHHMLMAFMLIQAP